jgi:aminoglycoside phosphotransferase (APT) family kinase protein
MPAHADAPVRRLASSGSTNALFRLGDELLVRLPRQPGGSANISKEATWLPVLGPQLPVAVPEVVAVFEPDHTYPERAGADDRAGPVRHRYRWLPGDARRRP